MTLNRITATATAIRSSPPPKRKPVGPSSRFHSTSRPSRAAQPKSWAATRAVVLDSSQAVIGLMLGPRRRWRSRRRAGGVPRPTVPADGWARVKSTMSRSGTGMGTGRRCWAQIASPVASAAPTRMSWHRVSVPS